MSKSVPSEIKKVKETMLHQYDFAIEILESCIKSHMSASEILTFLQKGREFTAKFDITDLYEKA